MGLRILLYVLVLADFGSCQSNHVSVSAKLQKELIYFKPMTEYVFQLTSNADLKSAQLNGNAKIGFLHLHDLQNNTGQEIYLRIHTMHLNSAGHRVMIDDEKDLTGWFSFKIRANGNVFEVVYPISEDPETVAVKKSLVGMISGHFHLPDEESYTDASWKYGVNETGSEGPHRSTYTATKSKQGILFKKIRQTHPIEYGKASHEKEIHYHSDHRVPTNIKISDRFYAPHKVPSNFDPYSGLGVMESEQSENTNQEEFPEMSVTSSSELRFLYSMEIQASQYLDDTAQLMSDSLHIKTIPNNMNGFNKTHMWNFVRSNLTCMREEQFKVSTKGTHCFLKLVHVFRNIPEKILDNIVDHFFHGNFSRRIRNAHDRFNLMDALVATESEYSQDLLTDNVLLSSAPDKLLVERLLMLSVSNNKTLSRHLVQTVTDLIFLPELFPATLRDRKLQRTAVMSLGAIAANLHNMGRFSDAEDLVQRVEENLGIHDPWNYNTRLLTIPPEKHDDYHFDTVALIEALGNAALDRSIEHILSFTNSTDTPHILRRAGLHSLRRYANKKVSNVLLSASQNDANEHVRHLAIQLYRAHPHGQKKHNVSTMVNESLPSESSEVISKVNANHRERRSIPQLDDELTYDFPIKSKEWSKRWGNDKFGASMGYSLRNSVRLTVRLLSGVLKVHAVNTAYIRLHVGILGFNVDVATANMCFDGAIGIRINLFKEYKCAVVEQFTNAFDRVIQHYIRKLAESIERFRDWILEPKGLPHLLDEFGDALQLIPQMTRKAVNDVNFNLERFSIFNTARLPPVVDLAIDVVRRATQIVKDFQLGLMEFYNSVSDAVLVMLHSASEQLIRAIYTLSDNIHLADLITAPHESIANVYKALVNCRVATDAILQVRRLLEDAGILGDGPSPYWKGTYHNVANLQDELTQIRDKVVKELGDWIEKSSSGKRSITESVRRERIKTTVLNILDDTWSTLNSLKSVTTPIQLVTNNFFDSTKILKGLYQQLRHSYQEVKSAIVKIFGPNVHKDFPREIRLTGNGCVSNGFYPTTADGYYSEQGVDLVTKPGQKVVAPYSGTISSAQDTHTRVRLVPSGGAFINTVVYIDNIIPDDKIPRDNFINVIAGTTIGVTANTGPCGSNHIHFVVRSELDNQLARKKRSQHSRDGTQDSSAYLKDRKLEITAWRRVGGCDDFSIKILGFTLTAGSITQSKQPREVNITPERIVDTTSLNVRRKTSLVTSVEPPQTPEWFHNIESAAETFQGLGLPIPEFGKPYPVGFNLKNLKIGPVLDFFQKLGLNDISSRLTNVLQSLAVLIADTPCVNPHVLTNDQLLRVLYRRGTRTEGSRSDLIRRYLSPDDRCPLLQVSLPQNTYCHIDQTCLAVECCLNLPLFSNQIALKAFARYDPCRSELVIGIYPWTLRIPEPDVGIDQEEHFNLDLKFLGEVKVKMRYIIEKTDQLLLVSLSLTICPSDGTCLPPSDVLKESAFMLPICNDNETLSWPDVNILDYFQRSDLVKALAVSGQTRLGSGIKQIATIMNLPSDIFSDAPALCHRPESMTYNQLVQALHSHGQNTLGTVQELVTRLTEIQRSCGNLFIPEFPAFVSDKLHCSVITDCHRIECCMNLTVGTFQPAFTLFMELNPCNQSFDVGFENMVFSHSLLNVTGNREDISGEDHIGWITLRHSLRPTVRDIEYDISFGVSVCPYETDCLFDISILENQLISLSCGLSDDGNGHMTTGGLRKKREESRYEENTAEDINYDNTPFRRSILFWNARLLVNNTTFTATENMNIRLTSTDTDHQNNFSLPLNENHSNIWREASVIGGRLTENAVLTNFLEERALKEIEPILDAQEELHRLTSVKDAFYDILDNHNITNLPVLLMELQQVFRSLVEDTIDDTSYVNVGNEFEARDFIITGLIRFPKYGRHYITLVEKEVTYSISILTLRFYVGIGAAVSFEIPLAVKVGTMTYTIGVTPGGGIAGWAGLSVGFVVHVGFQFVLEILGTDLPITREVNFCKFPIEVTDRVDIVVTPLVLRLFVKVELKVWIIKVTVYKKELWNWSTPSWTANLQKDTYTKEDDTIPKFFDFITDKIIQNEHGTQVQPPEESKTCSVEQITGLDYTEPALQLQVAAADDVSYVTYNLSVGTYPGGNEVINNQLFGGPSAVISEELLSGVPLYFTVTARNSGGRIATATCHLTTYDVTLPGGRVDAAFRSTSHPDILRASAVLHDDSEILATKESVGLGTGLWGDQIISWKTIESRKIARSEQIDNEFDHFTAPKAGKLVSTPITTMSYLNPNFCARDCIALPSSKCLSFNYDFGPAHTCELLQEIEGHGVEMHQSGLFSHFERLGVGHAVEIDHDNVQLVHNELYYFNIHTVNTLGYENIVSSIGILADFIPPEPGIIANASRDEVIWEECLSFTPEEWHRRCLSNTPLQNHRIIIDGVGSASVFNGHIDLEDLLYTRANKFISANWDGFHDNETGISGYTWSVGTAICSDDVSAHIDPHSHLFDAAEWTHEGLVSVLDLEDGQYFITVRALNKVEFGGPMAVTVCHTTPYVIDNTPPVINSIWNVSYDSDIGIIRVNVNYTDAESGIAGNHFALGRTPRDTYILEWQAYPYTSFLEVNFTIPDGVPAWVKVQAVNNVDLRTTGHLKSALLVDKTPPVQGIVFDGSKTDVDLKYFKDSNEICANWQNFHDAESGISSYLWAVGLEPGSSDVVGFTPMEHDVHRACAGNLTMKHGEVHFSTLMAFNGGYDMLNISGSSNGVRLDITPPVIGNVLDGYDEDGYDIQFSSEPASVSAFWQGFHDPESNISDYSISVHRQSSVNGNHSTETIHKSESVGGSSMSVQWHHFHLQHNDYVYVNLRTLNGAQNYVDTASNGYRVDLTPPILRFLGDGLNLGYDIEYQTHSENISVNWQYEDNESGITLYQFAIYEIKHGSRRKIFPADLNDNSFETISNPAATGHTQRDVHLRPGYIYATLVKAINGAKLFASHITTGIKVDTTPPRMLYVRAGAVDGDHEVILDGYVYQSDMHGIKASWRGIDSQSNIMAYWVAVGTEAHCSDVREFRSIGPDKGSYLSGLNLNLTNDDNCANECRPVYYVCVKAQNGAGEYSEDICSSPIRVVAADKTGYVTDGPHETILANKDASAADVDAQLEADTITVTFAGFASDLNGIRNFEWAIGTKPGGEDIQPYVPDGIVLTRNESSEEASSDFSGSGQAQAPVRLIHGLTYFTSVRARTGAGNVLETTSDGVTVDQSPPNIFLEKYGLHDFLNKSLLNIEDPTYQEDSVSLTATWNIEDTESAIGGVYYSVGSFPYDTSIANVTRNYDNNILTGSVNPNAEGVPNIINIQAINSVGLKREIVSTSLVIDTTAPIVGKVRCYTFLHARGVLRCHWYGFSDPEGTIEYFRLLLGSDEKTDDIFRSEILPGYMDSFKLQVSELSLEHNHRYYVTIEAVNTIGRTARAYSKYIIIDDTAPVHGVVVELPAIYRLNISNQKEPVNECADNEDCRALDALCLESVTHLSVAWEPFSDPETNIVKYEVAVGSTPFGTQVKPFTEVQGVTKTVIGNVDLSYYRQVFVSVRGYNEAGLYSTASSNGVYISRGSIGLSPLRALVVNDGSAESDRDFQTSLEQINATWDFSGDPCPTRSYEWAIHRIDGTAIQEFTDVGDQTHGTNTELHMSDGETYYVLVRGTNALGLTTTIRSDGITIQRDPLIPGHVFDGPFIGTDLNYQLQTNVIYASWMDFGKGNVKQLFDHTGNDEFSRSPPSKHIMDHYAVAVGTDRRYPTTRNNVVPFTNVGQNTTIALEHLNLQPLTSVYYVTVRAYSVSFATSEVSSNGITVGVNSKVAAGQVEIPRFVPSLDSVDVQWTGFESTLKMRFYYIGIGKMTSGEIPSIDCKHIQTMLQNDGNEAHFGLFVLQNTNLDTYKKISGLTLRQFETYFVTVIGFDEAGECNSTSNVFTVDNTLPKTGQIRSGPYYHKLLDYTATQLELHISWQGFDDPESGIKEYHIRLLSASNCKADVSNNLDTVADWITIEGTLFYHHFVDIYLTMERLYFVELEALNNAGGRNRIRSSPILFDSSVPTAGNLVDGLDFKYDETFHGDTTQISGSFLHLANPLGSACPILVKDFKESSNWTAVEMSGLANMDGIPWDIWYLPEQIFASNDELHIILERDVRKPRVLSGAYATEAHILRAGKYEVEILAASDGMNAITSVVFWDGPVNTVGDFQVQPPDKWWRDVCACCYDDLYNDTCLCNCTYYADTYSNSTVSQNVSQSSTSVEDAEKEFNTRTTLPPWQIYKDDDSLHRTIKSPQRACGLQLIPAQNNSQAVIWCRYHNDKYSPVSISINLPFNPSIEWHTYGLYFTSTQLDSEQRKVGFYIDGDLKGEIDGIPELSISTKLVLHVWNQNNFVPTLTDPFQPPISVARYRGLRLPAHPSNLCRYGDPFRGGMSPVISYMAGVGSSINIVDIVAFQEVARPCIPCLTKCDHLNCDEDCVVDAIVLFEFTLMNITLPERLLDDNVSAPIFVTVKSILGNGESVITSSSGVFLDTSAPFLDYMFYIDTEQGVFEPVSYQSSNSTIKVYWSFLDDESEIADNLWGIGSQPGGTDLQYFTSVGLDQIASNTDLFGKLQNNRTYYVTLKAINGAGISKLVECPGVTVLFSSPIPDGVNTTVLFSENMPSEVYPPNLMEMTNGSHIGMTWTKADDESVTRYDYCVGSSKEVSDDIVECIPVAINSSGSVSVSDGGTVHITGEGGEAVLNITEFGRSNKTVAHDLGSHVNFNLEPGKTVYNTLKLCNRADLCAPVQSQPTIIIGGDDEVATSSNGSDITIPKRNGNNRRKRFVNDEFNIQIQTTGGLPKGGSLLFGYTDEERTNQVYDSDAVSNYQPYIVNPEKTIHKTSRELKWRAIKVYEPTFYLSSLGQIELNGPLDVKTTFTAAGNWSESVPLLVFWNQDYQEWQNAGKTCGSTDTSVNAITGEVSFQVCKTRGSTAIRSRRRRLADGVHLSNPTHYFSRETQFAVIEVSPFTRNEPPTIQNLIEVISIKEDEGTIRYQFDGRDVDGDDIEFLLDPDQPKPSAGVASITANGLFTYTPCLDCTGFYDVHIIVRDVPTASEILPLSQRVSFKVLITEVGDYPVLFVAQYGHAIGSKRIVVLTVKENTGTDIIYEPLSFIIGAFDADSDDFVSIEIRGPDKGQLTMMEQTRNVPDESDRCSTVADKKLNNYTFLTSVPCGLQIPKEPKRLAWLRSNYVYQPQLGFYGWDKIMILAHDRLGLFSRHLTIIIEKDNPCINGICKGPEDDTECKNIRQNESFDGYSCDCLPNYSGTFCQDFDECGGNKCKDKDAVKPVQPKSSNVLIITGGVVGIVILFLLLVIIVRICYRRRMYKAKESNDVPSTLSKNAIRMKNIGNVQEESINPTTKGTSFLSEINEENVDVLHSLLAGNNVCTSDKKDNKVPSPDSAEERSTLLPYDSSPDLSKLAQDAGYSREIQLEADTLVENETDSDEDEVYITPMVEYTLKDAVVVTQTGGSNHGLAVFL